MKRPGYVDAKPAEAGSMGFPEGRFLEGWGFQTVRQGRRHRAIMEAMVRCTRGQTMLHPWSEYIDYIREASI